MITRQEALKLIEEHVENKNIIKHMLALEAVMGGIWEELRKEIEIEKLGGTKEEWKMSGLLHDGDYCEAVPPEKQGIQITEWVKAAGPRGPLPESETLRSRRLARGEKGFDLPENVAHAMAAHNWANTGVEPLNLMDWAIYSADSLTGLIVACALVLPSKKLADVTVEMVLKKFKSPSFAKGTRREEISLCQEKLGFSLADFVAISLVAMQSIADKLGL